MSVLLITYDFTKTDPAKDVVFSFIKQYKHVQVSEGRYAIETDEKTRSVFNKIKPCLSNGAFLFIVTIVKPFAGPVSEHVAEWFTKHLPEY